MRLHGYWQSGAVVQQGKPYRITGWDRRAETVTVTLKAQDNSRILEKTAAPVVDGRFCVTMQPRQGSFLSYTLTIEGSGTVTLTDICFGEVFLSSGQSNMEFCLKSCLDRQKADAFYHEQIRFLQSVSEDEANRESARKAVTPLDSPLQDGWHKAQDAESAGPMSAIAFYTAAAVLEKKQVPVGMVCTAMGGTAVEAWLSRTVIESDPDLMQHLKERGRYRAPSEFNQQGMGNYGQMTGLYNERIAPYKGISFAGILWLLGESSAADEKEVAYFERAFRLLIESWRKLFGARCPFFILQIASENYQFSPMAVPRLNAALSRVAAATENAWEAPCYDLPLLWTVPDSDVGHPIHPSCKAPYGVRMGQLVTKKLYDLQQENPFPTLKSWKLDGGRAILQFDGVGEGLCSRNHPLRGFTLCGEEGIHLEAEAKITGRGRLEIRHPSIQKATGFSYAYALYNQNANLVNSEDLPALPFSVDTLPHPVYTEPREWLYADRLTVFESCFEGALGGAGEIPLWKKGRVCRVSEAGVSLRNGICLTYQAVPEDGFYIGLAPVISTAGREHHLDTVRALRVFVSNPDDREKEFTGLLVHTVSGRRYMLPMIFGEERRNACPLPARFCGSFDLDLRAFRGCYLMQEAKTPPDLSDVTDMEFVFRDRSRDAGKICISSLTLML